VKIPWRALTMVLALLVIWVAFAAFTDGTFLTPRNLTLLARQMSVTSILAIAMVLVIVAGQIDLSVGALAGLAGAIAAVTFTNKGWPLAAAFLAALAFGMALGAIQGALVAYLRIPPFIVTLGGMLIFQGTLLGVTGGVSTSPPRVFLFIGQTYLPRAIGWGIAAVVAAGLLALAVRGNTGARVRGILLAVLSLVFVGVMNAYEGVPLPVLLVLVLAAALWVLAAHTPVGRHLYAIGGNREAAFYSGIAIERRVVLVFTLMGLFSAIAGIVLTARVGSATSDAGRMMELDAIAAAVIGGTSLLGGQGSVWGALLGALVMASLDNGMSLMNTEAYWQPILKGAILVVAVGADIASRRR
jgi:D-xylose transport system permease protein